MAASSIAMSDILIHQPLISDLLTRNQNQNIEAAPDHTASMTDSATLIQASMRDSDTLIHHTLAAPTKGPTTALFCWRLITKARILSKLVPYLPLELL